MSIQRECWSCGDTKVRGHCCADFGGVARQLPCVVCVPGAVMQCSCPPPEPNPHIRRLKEARANERVQI